MKQDISHLKEKSVDEADGSQNIQDSVQVLPEPQTEKSTVEVESIQHVVQKSVSQPISQSVSHPKLVPYFQVISPVPSLSVSSLKGESPYSDKEGETLSDEDDKEFEDPINNSVETNSVKSTDTSINR